MAASADINVDDRYPDGTTGAERGEVVVRRVMQFLAAAAGIDLQDCGGSWDLPAQYEPPLAGTVAEAARRFHGVDEAEAERRHAEYQEEMERAILKARDTPEQERRTAKLVDRALQRWNSSLKDEGAEFDAT